MKLNRSDFVTLLSIYCQPHTRWWPTQVLCPVATVTLRINNPLLLDILLQRVKEKDHLLSNQKLLYNVHYKWNSFPHSTTCKNRNRLGCVHNLVDVTFYPNNESSYRRRQQVRCVTLHALSFNAHITIPPCTH